MAPQRNSFKRNSHALRRTVEGIADDLDDRSNSPSSEELSEEDNSRPQAVARLRRTQSWPTRDLFKHHLDDRSDSPFSPGASEADNLRSRAMAGLRRTQSWPVLNPAVDQAYNESQTPLSVHVEDEPEPDDKTDSPSLSSQGTHSESISANEPPSYLPLYKAQEDARWWKKALAIFISVFTLPTLILPALTYWLWKRDNERDKEKDLVQKFEMPMSQYAALKAFRNTLHAPKLGKDNKDQMKPKKERIESKGPEEDKLITILTDREQAKRMRFFMNRKAARNSMMLSQAEKKFLRNSKKESVKLAPQLGYR